MPRYAVLTVDPAQTDDLAARLSRLDGVAFVSVQRGASSKPEGDVLSVLLTNRQNIKLLKDLDREGLRPTTMITIEPTSIHSEQSQDQLNNDFIEGSWEDSELFPILDQLQHIGRFYLNCGSRNFQRGSHERSVGVLLARPCSMVT